MNNGSKSESKKLTYEQLNDACNQLFMQIKQLRARNTELEQYTFNKRMDYLFRVLEFNKMFSSDFVISCSSEIENALTIPQDTEEKED